MFTWCKGYLASGLKYMDRGMDVTKDGVFS